MSNDRTKFTFHNQQNKNVELVIEPWALVEGVRNGGIVTFEVNSTPPPEVEFSVTEQGKPYVYVMSEQVLIYIDGVQKHQFQTKSRPPQDAFRILNKFLWSK